MEKLHLQPKRKHAFRLQGKNFFLTYPKCDASKEELLAVLQSKGITSYCVISREDHKDGTPHLHALVMYIDKIQVTKTNYFDIGEFHGNYQTARDSDDVRAYVIKADENPLEIGEYKSINQNISKAMQTANRNRVLIDLPLKELVDSGQVSLHHYNTIRQARMLYKLDSIVVPDYMPKDCYWIVGKPGIGKSRYIRDKHPGQFYTKPQNKWWDGYNNETIVLMDDFDKQCYHLGHYLKIWADCYSFNAEIKGGTIKPVIDTIYLTSNYTPFQIWGYFQKDEDKDMELIEAIVRRFKIVTIQDGDLVEYLDY